MLVTEKSGIIEETQNLRGKHENKEGDLQVTAQNKEHNVTRNTEQR